MEKILRRSKQQSTPAIELTPGAVPVQEGEPCREPVGVQVIWGALTERMELEGMTVADAERLLRGPFRIAPRSRAVVNGRPVALDHRLAAGEVLEFVRRAGEKGARA